MFRRISASAMVVSAVLASGITVAAQSNLNAKASTFQPAPAAPVETDRVRDGLVGPVRRVRTEVVKFAASEGRLVEGKRSLLELVAYDLKGNKTENQYFPVGGATLTGKESYKYDDKGNISEMTLMNEDGSLLSKESYRYEFDFAGNWNKMTTLVAVVDSGKLTFEPSEVTYRSIMYYLDENMVKMASQPNASPAQPSPAPANSVAADTTAAKVEPQLEAANNKPAANKVTALPPTPTSKDNLNASPAEVKGLADNSTGSKVIMDSEPPPSPAPRPILRPISGGVLNGAAIHLPPPTYPETAKRMRTAGVVTIEVVIDEIGKVISATAANGPATLREAAIQAALKARFSPTKLSGQPVKVFGTISYKFSLAQ